jgi:transmembrane sensor
MEAWFAAHPADAVLADSVKRHADAASASADVTVNVDAALASVRARFDAAPALTVVRGGAPRTAASAAPSGARRYWLAAAAVLVTVVGVQAWRGSQGASGAERTVATGVGQFDTLSLSDGSKVMLAPGSTITVAASFDRGDRRVTLTGAAFFDVQHDAAHPFTVRANDAEIRDIGTAFAVNTDVRGGVSVSVTHGIVALRNANTEAKSSVELRAGDRGVLAGGNVAVTRGTVTDEDVAWTRGQLTYRDTPLSEVQADLKRWYGITLEIADSSLNALTVTMPAQPDSARIISTIAALLGAEAEQRGDTVILHSAGRSTTP